MFYCTTNLPLLYLECNLIVFSQWSKMDHPYERHPFSHCWFLLTLAHLCAPLADAKGAPAGSDVGVLGLGVPTSANPNSSLSKSTPSHSIPGTRTSQEICNSIPQTFQYISFFMLTFNINSLAVNVNTIFKLVKYLFGSTRLFYCDFIKSQTLPIPKIYEQ